MVPERGGYFTHTLMGTAREESHSPQQPNQSSDLLGNVSLFGFSRLFVPCFLERLYTSDSVLSGIYNTCVWVTPKKTPITCPNKGQTAFMNVRLSACAFFW